MTKDERRAASARMTLCACGNTARLGETSCSRCEDMGFDADQKVAAVVDAIEAAIFARPYTSADRDQLVTAIKGLLP